MSRFYASIQGNRGEATRTGSANSGIVGHIRGWNVGVHVVVGPKCGNEDMDECCIYLTGGSNGRSDSILLGRFTVDDLKQMAGRGKCK